MDEVLTLQMGSVKYWTVTAENSDTFNYGVFHLEEYLSPLTFPWPSNEV